MSQNAPLKIWIALALLLLVAGCVPQGRPSEGACTLMVETYRRVERSGTQEALEAARKNVKAFCGVDITRMPTVTPEHRIPIKLKLKVPR